MKPAVIIPLVCLALALGCSKPADPAANEPPPTGQARPTTPSAAGTGTRPPPELAALPVEIIALDPPPEILEAQYLSAERMTDKLPLLDALTDAEPIPAIQSLTRLFHLEPDPDLKIEVLNALAYIDDAWDDQLALLAKAVKPDQPKPVRHAAIDLLIEKGNRQAIGVLQQIVNDADQEISEDAVFAIEELQADD